MKEEKKVIIVGCNYIPIAAIEKAALATGRTIEEIISIIEQIPEHRFTDPDPLIITNTLIDLEPYDFKIAEKKIKYESQTWKPKWKRK